jgi:hypothetical protein
MRRKNIILSDCTVEQQICSSDYTQHTSVPVFQTASRYLQQAMVPGTHLVSVHLCLNDASKGAYENALAAASFASASKNE